MARQITRQRVRRIATWQTTQPQLNTQLSTTETTRQVKQIDMPKTHFLSRILGRIHVLGVGTPTLAVNRIRVIAAGGLIVMDLEGGQLRGINKYLTGTVNNGVLVSTTDVEFYFTINFGRFIHDEGVILPAKLWKQLILEIDYTPGATTSVTSTTFTMTADELVSNDDPRSKFVRRTFIVQTVASAANLAGNVQIPPSGLLRAVFVHFDNAANVNANTPVYGGTVAAPSVIEVSVNGGVERPFSESADMAKLKNQETYRFDDGDTPDTELSNAPVFTGAEEMVCFDFDVSDDMLHVLDTSRLNDLRVKFTGAASGTSGDIHVIVDEVWPIVA